MFRGGLRRYEKRLVIIHVPSGPSLKGLLAHVHRDCFVLAKAVHLDSKQELGGETIVPRAAGVWVQTLVQEQA